MLTVRCHQRKFFLGTEMALALLFSHTFNKRDKKETNNLKMKIN